MILYKCDNVNCNFITRDASKLHMVKIDDKSFEVCDKCKEQILNMLLTKTNKKPALPKLVEKPKAVETPKTEAPKVETPKVETPKVAEKSEKNEQYTDNKSASVKSRCNAKDRIAAFGGVDAIRREYIDNNKSTSVLAKELGIAKPTLAKYLHDNCISKKGRTTETKGKKRETKNDKTEEKESHSKS